MQVFISWSGQQSHVVARALRAWLPKVLDKRVAPFVSSEDIDKGARGLSVIATELESSAFGIIVVTPSNVTSTWVNFEAGALGKSVETGRVAPLLVGLTDAELYGPLKQFQNTAADDREAVRALVQSMNRAQPDTLDVDTVNTLYDAHWPEFRDAVTKALSTRASAPTPKRAESDVLDEVLVTVRAIQRDVSARLNEATADPPKTLASTSNPSTTDSLTSRNRSLLRQLSAEVRDRLEALLFDFGNAGSQYSSSDDGVVAVMSADGPRITTEQIQDVRDLAASHGVVITLKRTDETALRLDPDGTTWRRGHGDAGLFLNPNGAASEF